MPMLAAKASRVDRKRTSFPSTRMVPESAAWTPAMIFIIVLLPAPFSPARPWISPAFSVKSTFRSAWTPPNDFEMSVSSSSAIGASTRSDQERLLHPQHAVGVRLGDHWPVGDDVLRNVRPRLRAVDDGLHAGNDRSAVNTARWIADRRIHLAILHRLDRGDERLSDRSAHIYVVGSEKGEDVDGVERRDQRVHVDDRNAGLDHLVDRSGQGADAERLDGDEIPLLRGHVVDRGALLDRVELAVEPGDV